MKTSFSAILASSLLLTIEAFTITDPSPSPNLDRRRTALSKLIAVPTFVAIANVAVPSANAAGTDDLIADLTESKLKLEVIPGLLENGEWDKVRTVLKTPPVNQLWNLGDSKNTLNKLARETGEVELLELKDELSISLQMCDQLTYDNAFVYFQPGTFIFDLSLSRYSEQLFSHESTFCQQEMERPTSKNPRC
jgi:hypothetical protein